MIGASDYHNIFQRPDLVEHLELLQSVGGNYVRNTMASREILLDHRDLWPYEVDWDASTLPHLSHTFPYTHILYNMNNETKESNEWGEY